MKSLRLHPTQKKNSGGGIDKYDLYKKSVQSPDVDVEFLEKTYKELVGKWPRSFREDFCGTFALSCEWVKRKKTNRAFAIDVDPEPMEYGRQHYFRRLSPHQQKRLQILEKNVLDPSLPHVDLVAALNFSFFLFKTRDQLKKYFRNVFASLKSDGVFICDVFGGSQCMDAIEDRHKLKGITYYWEQVGFDPVSHEAQFYIHFRVGSKKHSRVFSYDWRMWSLPELRELLAEVGFKKSHIYWEGTTKKGTGDGVFTRTEKGEACLSWVAYIAAVR